MGIVNATPDSFSDGGRHDPVAHALRLIEAGADWIDIGGESTRPGASPVSEAEELFRVAPVFAAVRAASRARLSVDTLKPAVARAAVAAGASLWNDVSALTGSSESLATCAALGCEVVLMHRRGDPRTMQRDPRYGDVVAEVVAFLAGRAEAAEAAGVRRDRIWLDPGIGFGKTPAHNLALIAGLGDLAALGYPVVLGASRKAFLGGRGPDDRLGGSLAVALAAARAGAAMLRVHDVGETIQALRLDRAIAAARHG